MVRIMVTNEKPLPTGDPAEMAAFAAAMVDNSTPDMNRRTTEIDKARYAGGRANARLALRDQGDPRWFPVAIRRGAMNRPPNDIEDSKSQRGVDAIEMWRARFLSGEKLLSQLPAFIEQQRRIAEQMQADLELCVTTYERLLSAQADGEPFTDGYFFDEYNKTYLPEEY